MQQVEHCVAAAPAWYKVLQQQQQQQQQQEGGAHKQGNRLVHDHLM
jgi:hypothetical protein